MSRFSLLIIGILVSGCGSVGGAVASDTRGPWFKSSHRQVFISNICLPIVVCIEKTKIKEKEAWNGPFKNRNNAVRYCVVRCLGLAAAKGLHFEYC